MVFKTVDACVDLFSPGVHDGADQSIRGCIVQVVGKGVYGRDIYEGFVQGKAQTFGCCGADSEAGEGTGAGGYCYGINGI